MKTAVSVHPRPLRHRVMSAVSLILLLSFNVQNGVSWDAGPSACMHDVCSGGKQNAEITFNDKNLPRKVAVKLRGNTHLWVVNNGLELLHNGQGHNADTEEIYTALRNKPCQDLWEEGLFDADEPPLVETAGKFGTHFYNAAGKDIKGNPTTVTRYTGSTSAFLKEVFTKGNPDDKQNAVRSLITGNKLGNARDNAYGYLTDMDDWLGKAAAATGKSEGLKLRTDALKSRNAPKAEQPCYLFGLALHYQTDMTQPMHAASFSAAQISTARNFQFFPDKSLNLSGFALHAAYEYWVPAIQADFPAKPNLTSIGLGVAGVKLVTSLKADEVFVKTSTHFNSYGKALYAALTSDRRLPDPNECLIDAKNEQNGNQGADFLHYQGPCFAINPEKAVVTTTGAILNDAYIATASFIYAALNNGPGPEPGR